MSKENSFELEFGTTAVVPKGASEHFRVPHSSAKSGNTLPLVAFLQKAPMYNSGEQQYYFATCSTSGLGLKCFLSRVSDGDTVQIVKIYSNAGRKSVVMVTPEELRDFLRHYDKDEGK